jgi:hypothetical protein
MGLMKQILIGLSPMYTTEDKELTLMLVIYIITPLHEKQLSEEFHKDRFWGLCFLLLIEMICQDTLTILLTLYYYRKKLLKSQPKD